MVKFQIYQAQQKDRRESEWFLLSPQLAPIQREASRCTRKSYDSISVPLCIVVLCSAGFNRSLWKLMWKAINWRQRELGDSLKPGQNISMCVGNKLIIPKVISPKRLFFLPAKLLKLITCKLWDKCTVCQNLFTQVSFQHTSSWSWQAVRTH